jgi:hypothetical protein
MALTAEEIQKIEEEELLRFKTRRTLEVCEKYALRDTRVTYRNPEAALYIRLMALVPLYLFVSDNLFPELPPLWRAVSVALLVAGTYCCDLLIKRKRAERAIWGLPLNVASHFELALDQIGGLALLLGIPVMWIRHAKGHNDELTFVVIILSAAALVVLGALQYNIRWPKGYKTFGEPPPLEQVFAEALKRQEAEHAPAAPSAEKAMSATTRPMPREG